MQIDNAYLGILLMWMIKTGLELEAVEVKHSEILAFTVRTERGAWLRAEIPKS